MQNIAVNLMPSPRVLRRAVRRRAIAWITILAIHSIIVVAACVVHVGNTPDAPPADPFPKDDRVARLTSDLADAHNQLADARSKEAVARLLTGHPDWSMLLAVLGNSLGDDAVLRDVKLIQSKGPGPRRYTLELRGMARTQAAASSFVSMLEDTHLFDQVRPVRTGREPFLAETVVTFDLQCLMSDPVSQALAGGAR